MKKIRKSRGARGARSACALISTKIYGQGCRGGGAASALIQGLLNLQEYKAAPPSALFSRHTSLPQASQPQKEEVVCVKISRQGLVKGAAVHLPGHCQFLEIT